MGVYYKLVIGRLTCWLTESDITSLDTAIMAEVSPFAELRTEISVIL